MERNRKSISDSKWAATAASVWIQCAAGVSYTFGIYSPQLKASQGYDQSTLGLVSVFKDIGASAGVLPGLLFSAVERPWVVHAAGAAQCFAGYLFMWAAVVGLIGRPPVAVMCIFMYLAAHAQTFFSSTSVVVGVRNFSGYQGTIVGILKGFLGISGAILVQFYKTLCNNNPTNFLLMLAVLPTLISLFFMLLVRVHNDESKSNTSNDKKNLNALYTLALITAAYLMILIILENTLTFSISAGASTFALLLLFLASPLGIVIRAQSEELKFSIKATDQTETSLLLDKASDSEELQDMNIVQAMRTINFWLLFVVTVCALGSGMATINNMSQLGESLGYTSKEITPLVSLWSIWNFLGRLGVGYFSDILLRTKGWARPILCAATLATMSVGHVVIAAGFSGNLYLGSMLFGACYGASWSLMPTITSEIFGVTHMGTIYNTIAIASPVGSYIFSVRVIGYIYDKEAAGSPCFGTHCFMLSFLVMAGVACFGCLVAITLFFRTRRFYRLVVLKRC